MASVNKVILVGNLGADPEMRYTAAGDAKCTLRLATTESWKDKSSGEKKEHTEWHRCVAYRRTAELMGQYLKKGSQVYLEGQIRTRKWKDNDGQDRFTTEIDVSDFQMLGGRATGDGGQREPAPARQDRNPGGGGGNAPSSGRPSERPISNDIPFVSGLEDFDQVHLRIRRTC